MLEGGEERVKKGTEDEINRFNPGRSTVKIDNAKDPVEKLMSLCSKI